jgi:hypothetical protein
VALATVLGCLGSLQAELRRHIAVAMKLASRKNTPWLEIDVAPPTVLVPQRLRSVTSSIAATTCSGTA